MLTPIFIPFFSIIPSSVIPGLIFTPAIGFSFFFLDYPTSKSCATFIYVAPCEGIKDSHGFWIPCRGFWIPITGFQIFQWTLIPDSSCQWDAGFLQLYSGSEGPGFRIPQAKNFQDFGYHRQKLPGFLYMGKINLSNLFGMCILIPSAMLHFEYCCGLSMIIWVPVWMQTILLQLEKPSELLP